MQRAHSLLSRATANMTSICAIRQLGAGQQGGQGPTGAWWGQKYDPGAWRPRYPRGFRDWNPGRARGAASATGTLPYTPVSGLTSDPQRHPMAGWGLQLEPGTENAPCARWPQLSTRNGSPSQQYFPSRTAVTELYPSVAGGAAVETRQPAAGPERAHAGSEARPEGPPSAQKFQVDSFSPLLKKASALNYLHLAGKFILVGTGCVYA